MSVVDETEDPQFAGHMRPIGARAARRVQPDTGPAHLVFYGTRTAVVHAWSAHAARLAFVHDHWPAHYRLDPSEVNVRLATVADLAWAADAGDRRFVAALTNA